MTQSEFNSLTEGNLIATDDYVWYVKGCIFNRDFGNKNELLIVKIITNDQGEYEETDEVFDGEISQLQGINLFPDTFNYCGFIDNKKAHYSLKATTGFDWDIIIHPQLGDPVQIGKTVRYLHELQNFYKKHTDERVEFPILYK